MWARHLLIVCWHPPRSPKTPTHLSLSSLSRNTRLVSTVIVQHGPVVGKQARWSGRASCSMHLVHQWYTTPYRCLRRAVPTSCRRPVLQTCACKQPSVETPHLPQPRQPNQYHVPWLSSINDSSGNNARNLSSQLLHGIIVHGIASSSSSPTTSASGNDIALHCFLVTLASPCTHDCMRTDMQNKLVYSC